MQYYSDEKGLHHWPLFIFFPAVAQSLIRYYTAGMQKIICNFALADQER